MDIENYKDMKEVVISIRSTHGYGREEQDTMDFTTDGLYRFKGGVGEMSYFESDVTGLDGTLTSLLVKPDEVVIDRKGSLQSRMVFREGSKNDFVYSTPYGSAMMGVDTRRIRHSFNEAGGSMEIDFIVNMEHTFVAQNRFRLNVREIQNGGHKNG